MDIWETIEFGAHALRLKAGARKSPEDIEHLQRRRLEQLISFARGNSDFWREKLSGVPETGFELTELPTSTKPELMDNFDEAVTVDDVRRDELEAFLDDELNIGTYFQDKYAVSHTSGSQGQPLLLVQSKDNIELLFALQASRGNHKSVGLGEAIKHIVSPARLAAVIFKPGFYASSSAFSYMPAGARHYLEVKIFCANDDDLPEKLAKYRPTHLTAYSSMLHEIARHIESGRISLKPHLEEVVNISERLMPEARGHYAELFGAPVLDNYSMGECLFLTNGCPTSGGMHVNADWAMLEVVDENNKPVRAGDKGAKVLVTNLANYVQPIIRYEIGDIITMATEPCNCGSNLPLIKCVDGRDSDVFKIKTESGERKLQPTIFQLALGRMIDVREYQIIQEDNTRFRILLEPLPGQKLDRARADKIMQQQLRDYDLDKTLGVTLEAVDRLATDGESKFKRCVTEEAYAENSDEKKTKHAKPMGKAKKKLKPSGKVKAKTKTKVNAKSKSTGKVKAKRKIKKASRR
jgi:phenylacetate-coenzyme A ligase PaaK-like adenylate-forming protein